MRFKQYKNQLLKIEPRLDKKTIKRCYESSMSVGEVKGVIKRKKDEQSKEHSE